MQPSRKEGLPFPKTNIKQKEILNCMCFLEIVDTEVEFHLDIYIHRNSILGKNPH